MDDQQLLRYSRQILLPQFDIEGQQALLDSRVLIIGMGGLGSPVAMYLAAVGIGHLTLVDDDEVEISNLQRQIIHGKADLGRAKVESAADTLRAQNPEVELVTVNKRLQGIELEQAVQTADIVVDCSDNFATRFLLNKVTQCNQTPLVSGAAIRMEGQVTVYDARREGSACYHCLYEDKGELQQTCSESGIFSPLLSVIGGMQAIEAVKLLAGVGESLSGRLLTFDAFSMRWREIRIKQDPNCPVCTKVTANE